MASRQDGPSQGWDLIVVSHQDGPSQGWDLIVVSHQDGPSQGWDLIVVSHQDGPSQGWDLIVVSHQDGPSQGWDLLIVVSRQGCLSVAGSSHQWPLVLVETNLSRVIDLSSGGLLLGRHLIRIVSNEDDFFMILLQYCFVELNFGRAYKFRVLTVREITVKNPVSFFTEE